MRRRLKHFLCSDQSGAAFLELAFVLPLFLLMFFGVLEFAMVLFYRSVVESATHETARLAITGSTYGSGQDRDSFLQARINQLFNDSLPSEAVYTIDTDVYDSFRDIGSDPIAAPASSYGSSQQIVRYTVTYNHQFVTLLPSMVADLGDSLTIIATAFVKNEAY